MSTRPSVEQFNLLRRFLEACENAAVPPSIPLPAQDSAMPAGLLGAGTMAPPRPTQSLMERALSLRPPPVTLIDLLGDVPVPFEASERLGADRSGRVAVLEAWMRRFPAFVWMSKQPSLRAGHDALLRISKRRAHDPKFSDDISVFRYWLFAVWAVMFINAKAKPQAIASERQQATAAAAKLIDLSRSTTLLQDAGLNYSDSKSLLQALEQLQSLSTVKRRKRTDSFSPDRLFVENLAWRLVTLFGDAPPAIVCEVAALKVRNPDKVTITKQISEYKRRRAAEPL